MANASRDLIINKNSTRWLGINAKSVAVAKAPIDITTDEDNGYRLLLDKAGTKTLDISFSGVTKDNEIRKLINTEQIQLYTDIDVEFPPVGAQVTGDTITGDFYLADLTEDGSGSDGAITFSGSLQSSGEWTYTEGSIV